MEIELKALNTWSALLDEEEHTAAISQLIEETTLTQVDVLLKKLTFRKAELESIYTDPGDSDEDSCWSGETSCGRKKVYVYQQRSNVPTSTSFRSPTEPSSCPQHEVAISLPAPTAPSPNIPISRAASPIPTTPSDLSPSIRAAILTYTSPLQKSPTNLNPNLLIPIPGIPPNLQELQNPPSKKAAKMNLVRLTLSLNHQPSPLYSRRSFTGERRIPNFPIEGKDTKWLSRWLYSLRLHKYAKNLQGLSPRELLELSEEEIIARGVDTVGARNKLILALREAKASLDAKQRLSSS